MKSPFKRKGEGGFTFIELLAVLLIMGIGVAVVTTSFGLGYEKNVLRQEAVKLRATMAHAREVALTDRVPVEVAVSAPEDVGGRTTAGPGRYSTAKLGSAMGRAINLPAGISTNSLRVVFYPKGNSTGGTVLMKDRKGRTYVIEVDPVTGTARLKRLQSP